MTLAAGVWAAAEAPVVRGKRAADSCAASLASFLRATAECGPDALESAEEPSFGLRWLRVRLVATRPAFGGTLGSQPGSPAGYSATNQAPRSSKLAMHGDIWSTRCPL